MPMMQSLFSGDAEGRLREEDMRAADSDQW
jgi:hypothetical protein